MRSVVTMIWVMALACVLALPATGALQSSLTGSYHQDHRHTPRLLVEPGVQPVVQGQLRQTVEAYLKSHADQFGFNSDLSNLKLDRVEESLMGRHYRYRQDIGGVPVEDAEIIVSIRLDGKIYRVFNNIYPQRMALKSVAAPVGAEVALDKAWAHLRVHGALHRKPEASLVYIPEGEGFRLIYKTLISVNAPRGSWEHRIDAETGEIISAKDRRKTDQFKGDSARGGRVLPDFKSYTGAVLSRKAAQDSLTAGTAGEVVALAGTKVDGTAKVFDPDPRTALANDSLVHTSPAASFAPAYVTRTLRGITLNGGIYSLAGPYVTVTDWDTPTDAPSTSTTGNWTATRGVNAFNDVMVYYHIDTSQRYVQSLGFTNVQNRSIPVDSDGAQGEANAYFDPNTDRIAFGHGTAAPSTEDTDVIIHEYGHAIQFGLNASWGDSGDSGAMGEGFCDYWAASYRYFTTNGSTFHPTWMGHWFMNTSGTSPMRTLDKTNIVYNPGTTYTAHQPITGGDSDELWSAPLFQSFLALLGQGVARQEVDRILMESYYGIGANPTMRDMANVIVSTAQQMYPNGPHAQVFYAKFAAQNILVAMPLAAPSMTYPSSGDIFLTNATAAIQWSCATAPTNASVVLEYTRETNTVVFSDTMEKGVNGWTVSHALGSGNWAQATDAYHSALKSWKAVNLDTRSDQYLVSPAIAIPTNAVLSVWHGYNLDWFGDGGVIEISTNNQVTWIDLGSRMTQNGYNGVIESMSDNPLAGRNAFMEDSSGFRETLINLADFAGRSARFRFRMATDSFNFVGVAWWVDDVSVYKAASWNPIGTLTAGKGNTLWTVPPFTSTNYVIRGKLTASNYSDSAWAETGTFTVSADTDGDGIPDAWELRYASSLTNMTSVTDSDKDGLTDRQEYLAGTGPTNTSSVLIIRDVEAQPDMNMVMRWSSVAGRRYSLLRTTSLVDAGSWQVVVSNVVATPPTNICTNSPGNFSTLFYRIRLE